jgi:hypothetical protein
MAWMEIRHGIAKALALAAVAVGLCCHALPASAHVPDPSAGHAAVQDCAGHGNAPAATGSEGSRPACCVDAPADVAAPSFFVAPSVVWAVDLPAPEWMAAVRSGGLRPRYATGPPKVNRVLAALGAYRS